MNNYKGKGLLMPYTNSGSAIASGAAVVVGNRIGVAKNDIPANTVGVLHLEGEFQLAAVSDAAFTQGVALYWNVSESKLTATATGNIPAGIAFEAKTLSSALATVRLQPVTASAGGGGADTVSRANVTIGGAANVPLMLAKAGNVVHMVSDSFVITMPGIIAGGQIGTNIIPAGMEPGAGGNSHYFQITGLTSAGSVAATYIMQIFDNDLYLYDALGNYPAEGTSIIFWTGMNTSWTVNSLTV